MKYPSQSIYIYIYKQQWGRTKYKTVTLGLKMVKEGSKPIEYIYWSSTPFARRSTAWLADSGLQLKEQCLY